MALAPTEANSHAALAMVLSYTGRTENALEAAAQALRLKSEVVDAHLDSVGAAYAVAERYEEERAPLQRYSSRYPNVLPVHLMLAAVYSEVGKEAEAHAEATEVLRLNPNFSLEVHKQRMPIKDPATLERHIAALRKAGVEVKAPRSRRKAVKEGDQKQSVPIIQSVSKKSQNLSLRGA
ncbi:MAG: hypothetical protein AB7G75_00005 [Candidatus Binatia bacterium]